MSKRIPPDMKATLLTFAENYFMQEMKLAKSVFDHPPPKPGTQDFARRYAMQAHGKKEALNLLKLMAQFQAGLVDHHANATTEERKVARDILREAQKMLGVEQREASEIMRNSAALEKVTERMRQEGINPDDGLPLPTTEDGRTKH